MQQLRFINNTLTQHVSGTIMPIFRSARTYIAAYDFQQCKRRSEYGVSLVVECFFVLYDSW